VERLVEDRPQWRRGLDYLLTAAGLHQPGLIYPKQQDLLSAGQDMSQAKKGGSRKVRLKESTTIPSDVSRNRLQDILIPRDFSAFIPGVCGCGAGSGSGMKEADSCIHSFLSAALIVCRLPFIKGFISFIFVACVSAAASYPTLELLRKEPEVTRPRRWSLGDVCAIHHLGLETLIRAVGTRGWTTRRDTVRPQRSCEDVSGGTECWQYQRLAVHCHSRGLHYHQ
jgi:hypothetical protein